MLTVTKRKIQESRQMKEKQKKKNESKETEMVKECGNFDRKKLNVDISTEN